MVVCGIGSHRVVIVGTWWYWVSMGMYWFGWYLVVLSPYGDVLVGTL